MNTERHKSHLNDVPKPQFDNAALVKRLEKPKGPIDVVFDADAYTEIDDQYALAYMMRSEDKLKVKALYAAPFYRDGHHRSNSPKEGMEKSYAEIKNILSLIDRDDMHGKMFNGSEKYLPSETEPVISDAANDLAKRAMEYTPEKPLYVIAIGAITNIASALLINPEIKDRIVIVWLGGHALDWPDIYEFNLYQDVAAARVVFGSGAALVLLPCRGVVSEFSLSKPEIEYWMRGKNKLCDYLANLTIECSEERFFKLPTWAKPIWDVTAVAWLLDGDFMYDRLEPCPIPGYDYQWGFDRTRHLIRYVYSINRTELFYDLFQKITK